PCGSAGDEADLQQVWLDDLGERLRVVVDRRRHGLDAHGAAAVHVDDGLQEPAVELVEPTRVHALALKRVAGDRFRDDAIGLDLRVGTHATAKTVRHARGDARAPGDLARPPARAPPV